MKAFIYTVAAAVILVIGFVAVANNAHQQWPTDQRTASNQATLAATACGGVGRGGDGCSTAQ